MYILMVPVFSGNVNLTAREVFDGYVGWCRGSGEPGFVGEGMPIYSGYIWTVS